MPCPICGAAHTVCTGETPAPQFTIDIDMEVPIMAYTADRRLYLDKAGKVVEDDDPTKETLLVGVGGMLPLERARELGLLDEKAKAEPAENKAKPAPAANKAKA